MESYIVNINTDDKGKHEVHNTSCMYLPEYYNRSALGWHDSCSSAVSAANLAGYSPADGCYYCCNQCHTG